MRASGWGTYSLPYLPDKCKAGRKISESDNPGQLTHSLTVAFFLNSMF